jgi:hypothetical protein
MTTFPSSTNAALSQSPGPHLQLPGVTPEDAHRLLRGSGAVPNCREPCHGNGKSSSNYAVTSPGLFLRNLALCTMLKFPPQPFHHQGDTHRINFPLSLLDDRKVQNLLLSGSFEAEGQVSNPSLLQLNSLILCTPHSLKCWDRIGGDASRVICQECVRGP